MPYLRRDADHSFLLQYLSFFQLSMVRLGIYVFMSLCANQCETLTLNIRENIFKEAEEPNIIIKIAVLLMQITTIIALIWFFLHSKQASQ